MRLRAVQCMHGTTMQARVAIHPVHERSLGAWEAPMVIPPVLSLRLARSLDCCLSVGAHWRMWTSARSISARECLRSRLSMSPTSLTLPTTTPRTVYSLGGASATPLVWPKNPLQVPSTRSKIASIISIALVRASIRTILVRR